MLNKINSIDTLVEYWKPHQDDLSRASYPLHQTEDFLREHFGRVKRDPNSAMLCYGPEADPEGIFFYFWQPEDKYLQTVFCMFHKDEAFEAFLAYLRNNHPGYEAYLGFAAQNAAAAEALLRDGYALIEDSIDFRMAREDFAPWQGRLPKSAEIHPVADTDWDEYAPIHDGLFEGIYWTSERLRTAGDRWRPYFLRLDGKIIGCLLLFVGDICEVFGLGTLPGQEDDALYCALLSHGLAEACRGAVPFSEIVFMPEQSEPYCITAAEAVGMRRHCMYRCYSKAL